MTRENKLALVVGFGLILFVGILISDHFAPSPHRNNADLIDPKLKHGTSARGELTDLTGRQPIIASASGTGSSAPLGGGPLGPGIAVAPGDPQPSPEDATAKANVQPPEEPTFGQQPSERVYVIREGDTLYSIASRELGDGTLWPKLQELNGIKAKALRPGDKIRLPAPDAGGTTRLARNERSAAAPEVPSVREYVVREGDTLSRISKKLFGTPSRFQELYDLNKRSVPDRDRLVPGTRLMVPSGAKGDTRA